MSTEIRKPLGLFGLDLSVDPAQGRGLVIADGVRYTEDGSIWSRLGRKRFGLSFPYEGVGNAEDYVETISHFQAPGKLRGISAFYDQRIETRSQEHLNNGSFDSGSQWTTANDFSIAGGKLLYVRGVGNGSVQQAVVDLKNPIVPGASYEFIYTVLANAVTVTVFQIVGFPGGGVPETVVDLPFTAGTRHRVTFVANENPTIFFVQLVTSAGTTMELDDFQLRQIGPTIIPPQRLNFVYKVASKIYLNNSTPGDGTGIIDGVLSLDNPKTRAKIVTYGDKAFIIDPDSRPLILRRRPVEEQDQFQRVRYDLRNCGINWPRHTTDVPVVAAGSGTLPSGIYRYRVQLENKMGDQSSMSLGTTQNAFVPGTSQHTISRPEIPADLLSGPNAATHWRLYVSFAAASAATSFVPQTEPSAFVFWQRLPLSTTSAIFDKPEFDRIVANTELATFEFGAPPKLIDFAIVNGISYGIAAPDVIARETVLLSGDERPAGFGTTVVFGAFRGARIPVHFSTTFFDNTEIKEIRVDSSQLFIGRPGEPQYMEHRFSIAEAAGEIGVGLFPMGDKMVVFTNKDVIIFDGASFSQRRTHAGVGLHSRDSIEKTERGLRFLGTDLIPRIFNGATVEILDRELEPVMAQEDYRGFYKSLDERFPDEVSVAAGDGSYYLNYPVVSEEETPATVEKNIAIANQKSGRKWSIDRTSYQEILWLGRESKLIGVAPDGFFYRLETGFIEEDPLGSRAPLYVLGVRWFGQPDGRRRVVFKEIEIEVDTRGAPQVLACQVDANPSLSIEFDVTTDGRQIFKKRLPPHFRGLYLEARLSGQTGSQTGRVRLYDVRVETVSEGV